MTWTVEVSNDGTNWVDADALEWRNVTGAPVDAVTRQTTPWVSIEPGVLRYYVKPGTLSAGVSADLLCKVVNDEDLLHELIDGSTGITVDLTVGNENTNLITGVTVQLNPNMGEDDEFELSPGYTWDSSLSGWEPVMVLGIVTPDYSSRSLYIKFTNGYSRDLVECSVIASASLAGAGISRFEGLECRLSGESWVDPSVRPFWVNPSGNIAGHIPTGESVTVELRGAPGAEYDGSDNPILLTVAISGREV